MILDKHTIFSTMEEMSVEDDVALYTKIIHFTNVEDFVRHVIHE
jgi:hypothetical protein